MKVTSEYLEIDLRQIEIIHVRDHVDGVLFIFMYNHIIYDGDLNINDNDEDIYMRRMLTGTDDVGTIVELLNNLEGDDRFKIEMQNAYKLNNVPRHIISFICNLVHDENNLLDQEDSMMSYTEVINK